MPPRIKPRRNKYQYDNVIAQAIASIMNRIHYSYFCIGFATVYFFTLNIVSYM